MTLRAHAKAFAFGFAVVAILGCLFALIAWSGLASDRRVYVRTSNGRCVALVGRVRPAVVPQPSWRCQ